MVIDKNGNIDFGTVTLPKSWDELTLKMYTDIERFYADKESTFDVRNVLNIMCGLSVEEIDQLPIEFVEKLLEQLEWIKEAPSWGEPSNKVEIDGVEYKVNIQDKLKTGEYIALDTVLKGDKHNYAAMLAVMCRKDGELYDSKFENEVLGDRIKMWEQVPVVKVMPICAFFLSLWVVLQKNTQLSSMVEEAINLTAKSIETSRKNGDLSMLSTKLLMRKLKKLRKSTKCI